MIKIWYWYDKDSSHRPPTTPDAVDRAQEAVMYKLQIIHTKTHFEANPKTRRCHLNKYVYHIQTVYNLEFEEYAVRKVMQAKENDNLISEKFSCTCYFVNPCRRSQTMVVLFPAEIILRHQFQRNWI